MRVLVVDDEIGIGKAIRRMLASDHEVVIETDPVAARERLARERFDVVFCDLVMPSMTGMDLYESVAASAPDVAARFVFITAGAFSERSEELLNTTKNPYLLKPFTREDILRVLESLRG
ncbi:MAG TPA: response regulator [Labilithrix sp.]